MSQFLTLLQQHLQKPETGLSEKEQKDILQYVGTNLSYYENLPSSTKISPAFLTKILFRTTSGEEYTFPEVTNWEENALAWEKVRKQIN